jgi:trigger factor
VKVTVERAENSEAILNVELEWRELESASDRAYHKLAQRYNVPGFRRGHAPRSMLERMLGKEAIYQEGLEALIEDSYREAIRSNQLVPLAQPAVDAPPLQLNAPYSFSARVPVLSPVKLGDYQAVHVEKPAVEVTDEDVDKVVADLQQQHALWLPAERPAQLGDRVIADLKLEVGDRTISDLHDNEFELAEGREGIFSGMDEHLLGVSEGETKEFTTTIPADYANAELAGQEAHYTVTLKGVKYRELPEADDELAKSIGEYDSLEALRAGIREQLIERRTSNAERDYREQLLKAIADQAEVEIHPVLIEDETGVMVREMQRILQQSGLSFEQFLSATNSTEADYKKQLEPEARERVKRDLVLDAIGDAEGIEASDRELQGWLDMLSAVGGDKPMRLRQLSAGQRQHVTNRVRRDKVIARLVGNDTNHVHTHAHSGVEQSEPMEAPVASALHAARVGADVTASDEPDAGAAPAVAGNGTPTDPAITAVERDLSVTPAASGPEAAPEEDAAPDARQES